MAKEPKQPTKAKKAKKQKKPKDPKSWTILAKVSAFAATFTVRQALNSLWRAATGKKPPKNAGHPDLSAVEAAAWAVASGALVALAKMAAARKAANYWRKSTGDLPPTLRPKESA